MRRDQGIARPRLALLPARRRTAGFTLMEIMVAMVIFTVMLSALYASFNTGMRTYDLGTKHAESQQLGRYSINQVAQDLRNIYYKPEAEYNVTRRQREALLDEQEQQVIQSGTNPDAIDENLPDLGPPIDLSFKGEDGGDVDTLTLVRNKGNKQGDDRPLWGLSRITYYVNNGHLYRSVDDITKPDTDEAGNVIPKLNPPRVDKLANNCVGFNLRYGYYADGEYKLTDSWESSAAQYRNPPEEEDDDIIDPSTTQDSQISGQGQAALLSQQQQQQEQQQRADELPGWIELTFKFAEDPEKSEKLRIYNQTILLYHKNSQETYVPPEEDENERSRRPEERRGGKSRTKDERDRTSERGSRDTERAAGQSK